MRKTIVYDKKYLTEKLNYSKVPVRQILALDLKPLTQLLLIQMFSHSENWGVSFNQISKSFYHNKNRKDIKIHYEELKSKGYLKEDDNSYYIILTQIQRDYETFLKKGDKPTTSVNPATIDSTPISQYDSPAASGMLEPLPAGDSTSNSLIVSTITSNNINNKNKEKDEEITSINNDSDKFQQSTQNISDPDKGSCYNPTPIDSFESSSSNTNEDIVKSSSNSTLQDIPTFHFTPFEIQYQIDEYLKSESKFFKGDNQAIVPNSYTEYYKQYPTTQLTITKYEQVLYVQLMQASMSVDVNALDEYLTNTPTIVNPAYTHDIVKMVNDNDEAQVIFKSIIEKVNHITHDNNRV